jgi:hypothetical protein
VNTFLDEIVERLDTGMLESVQALSYRANIIDPAMRIGVYQIVRRTAVRRATLLLPILD